MTRSGWAEPGEQTQAGHRRRTSSLRDGYGGGSASHGETQPREPATGHSYARHSYARHSTSRHSRGTRPHDAQPGGRRGGGTARHSTARLNGARRTAGTAHRWTVHRRTVHGRTPHRDAPRATTTPARGTAGQEYSRALQDPAGWQGDTARRPPLSLTTAALRRRGTPSHGAVPPTSPPHGGTWQSVRAAPGRSGQDSQSTGFGYAKGPACFT